MDTFFYKIQRCDLHPAHQEQCLFYQLGFILCLINVPKNYLNALDFGMKINQA